MPMEFFWLAFFILCLIAGAATVQFDSLWFEIGLIASVLIVTTKLIAKKLTQGMTAKINTDRIIGEKAVVIEDINNSRGTGQIRVMNQVWTARAIIPEMFFPVDSEVIVHEISGVKAIVRPVESPCRKVELE